MPKKNVKRKDRHCNILLTLVIDKLCKMTVKGEKLMSESFFDILWYFAVLEEKIGADSTPSPDGVKDFNQNCTINLLQ